MMTKSSMHLLLAAAISTTLSSAAFAVEQDHLTCFKTRDPAKVAYALDLVAIKQPEFIAKGCKVAGMSVAFCVPSTKALRDPSTPKVDLPGSLLEFDYVMYKIKCPRTPLPTKQVTDQLAGARNVRFSAPISVLVPATKANPPCGLAAAGQCGGECPAGEACVLDQTGKACGCAPPPKPCGVDAAGVCGGECVGTLLQTCETRVDAQGVVTCGCFPRSAACGLSAGANQCGGSCAQGETCKTFITAAGGVSCDCVK
ncbi:MAG: hypothetical protein ACKOCT_20565 [Alphaproteobacteria bacterium]